MSKPTLLSPGIWSLEQTRGGNVHAYLIKTGEWYVAVDTLYDEGEYLKQLQYLGISPTKITFILLTHAHKSHLGGLRKLVDASGADVLAHASEIPIIEGRAKAKPVGWQRPKPFNARVFALQAALNFGLGSHKPVKVTSYLKEGMSLGGIQIIGLDGHTEGSLGFYVPDARLVITGDALATWPTVDRGWRGFNLDDKQALRSVGKLADIIPLIACPGHGDPITEGTADILKELANGKV